MEGELFRLDGKGSVVTGASQGIGKALAMGLAEAGASVAVTDLPSKRSETEKVCEEINSLSQEKFAVSWEALRSANI